MESDEIRPARAMGAGAAAEPPAVVGICESELIGSPHEGQKRLPAETTALHEGHRELGGAIRGAEVTRRLVETQKKSRKGSRLQWNLNLLSFPPKDAERHLEVPPVGRLAGSAGERRDRAISNAEDSRASGVSLPIPAYRSFA